MFYYLNRGITSWFAFRDLKSHSILPPAMGKHTFHQTRLLQAPSKLVLDTSKGWVNANVNVKSSHGSAQLLAQN